MVFLSHSRFLRSTGNAARGAYRRHIFGSLPATVVVGADYCKPGVRPGRHIKSYAVQRKHYNKLIAVTFDATLQKCNLFDRLCASCLMDTIENEYN
jgi:hypothetical protein